MKDHTIIGHRGSGSGMGSAGLRENSLASMEKALQDGADEIECDLAITHDEKVIFFHDSTVAIGDDRKAVQDMSFSEMEKAVGVNLLKDGLNRIGADRMILELKSYSNWRSILDRLDENTDDPGRLRFICFMPEILCEIKKRWPSARCNFIATCLEDRFEPWALRRHVDLCIAEGMEEISGHILLFPRRTSEYAITRGLDVGLGMIDNSMYLRRCRSLGVTRLYSNRVGWLKGRLGS